MNLNKIVVGTAQIDEKYGFNKEKNFKSIIETIKGLSLAIDTSPVYKGSYLYSKDFKESKVDIISKLPIIETNINNYEKKLEKSIEDLFKKIGNKKLDTLLIHDPLLPLDKKKWLITIKKILILKKKKKIKKIGISVYTPQETKEILKVFVPDVIQFPLNIFDQSFLKNNLLKELKKKNIELHARSIFLQGLALQKKNKLPKYFLSWKFFFNKWYDFLKKKNISAIKFCIQFVLDQKLIDKFVIGFDNKKQLNEVLQIIKKHKQGKKTIYPNQFSTGDRNLIDPRFWPKNKNKTLGSDHKKWIEAKNIIASGNMLLSKKPVRFLPGGWPTYYSKAKGCFVWDDNGKKYLDFCLMGIGTNILGYANKKINNKIHKTINNSNVSTLNSYDEVRLTKKLLKLNPWASMAFFAKTGAEANSIALRIARVFNKKFKIAICGYHGWHDWYISTNLKNENNLNNMLLEGISTAGIPSELKNMTIPFKYNDLSYFKKVLNQNPDIGVVFMEVERNQKPKKNFLKEVRKITVKKNIVLIFDECTSGFRETFGGLHLKYKINPDICIFGKALGNGYPITAIVGKKEIMECGNSTFISSTFWTDKIGFTASLATLELMEKTKSWRYIAKCGRKIKKFWKKIANKYDVPIKISGLDSMPSFEFLSKKNEYYKCYLTQEMLRNGVLATNTVYCAYGHLKYFKLYCNLLDKIFYKIKIIDREKDILGLLNFPLPEKNFKRLN